MSKLLFWWIDDDASRERQYKYALEKKLGVKLNFISVQRVEIYERLEERIKESENRPPDLVIIDHILNNTVESLIQDGSLVADLVRKKWPNCPIVGVSAGIEKATILDREVSYDEIYSLENFTSAYESLKIMAISFRKLKRKRPADKEALINYLKAPIEERERLLAILPNDLKSEKGYNDPTLLQRIFRWVRYTLQRKPGFLYDKLWVSTLVGVKESSFNKIANYIESARYRGIFSDPHENRWWQFLIKKKLYSDYFQNMNLPPWELGRRIEGVVKRDFSVCYVCGGEFPEIVGYTDESAKTRIQLHLRCSIPHPNFKSALYFEETRMATGE